MWNSIPARILVPDYFTTGQYYQGSAGVYIQQEVVLTIALRGDNPGIYFTPSTEFGPANAVDAGAGDCIRRGNYLRRNAEDVDVQEVLVGWQGSVGVGYGVEIELPSFSGELGVSNFQVNSLGLKMNQGAGLGVTKGVVISERQQKLLIQYLYFYLNEKKR